MSFSVNQYQNSSNSMYSNQELAANVIPLTLVCNTNKFLTLEQFKQEIASYDISQLYQSLTQTKFRIETEAHWLINNTDILKTYLDLIQKQALKIVCSKLFEHQDLLLNIIENKTIRTFLELFDALHSVVAYNLYCPIGNDIYISPIALLLYLPKDLIYLLNPDALIESLGEFASNSDNTLFTYNGEVTVEYLKLIISYLNKGLDISPLFCKEFKWVMKQPLFKNAPLDNFCQILLDSIYIYSHQDITRISDSLNIQGYDHFKLNFSLALAEIFNNHPIFHIIQQYFNIFLDYENSNVFIKANLITQMNILDSHKFITCGATAVAGTLTVVLNKEIDLNENFIINFIEKVWENINHFEVPANYIFSHLRQGKRKLLTYERSHKRQKISDSTSSSTSGTYEHYDQPDFHTIQTSPLLSKLPRSLKHFTVTTPPLIPWLASEINFLLSHFDHLESLKLPLEIFSEEDAKYINFSNVEKLTITTNYKLFNLSDEELRKQVKHFNQIPSSIINIEIHEENDFDEKLLNLHDLIHIIKNCTNTLNFVFYSESEILEQKFMTLFCQFDQFEAKVQKQLVEILNKSFDYDPEYNNYYNQIFYQIFSSHYDSYPLLDDCFEFSQEFIKDSKKLKYLLNKARDNSALIREYPRIVVQLLTAAIKSAHQNQLKTSEEMCVDTEEEISESLIEQVVLKLLERCGKKFPIFIYNNSVLFSWLMKYPLFLEKIPANAKMMGKLLIDFVNCSEGIEEDWLQLFKSLLKYQIIQNNNELQKKIIEKLDSNKKITYKIFNEIKNYPLPILDKTINKLLFLAPTFAKCLDHLYGCREIGYVELKDSLSLLFRNGWIPSLDYCYCDAFSLSLLTSLKQSLPNLNELQKQWVPIVLRTLEKTYELTETEQEDYCDLFNYHCIQKQRPFEVRLFGLCLDHYPYIFERILSYYCDKLYLDRTYLELGMRLLTISLSQQIQGDHNVIQVLALLDCIIPNLTNFEAQERCHVLLVKTPLLFDLFKQAYVISKSGRTKMMKVCTPYLIQALCNQTNKFSHDIEYLLAHAILESKGSFAISNEVLKNLSPIFFEIITKQNTKDVSVPIIQIFINDYQSKFLEYTNSPSDNSYYNLVDFGKKIFELIFRHENFFNDELLVIGSLKSQKENGKPEIINKILCEIIQSEKTKKIVLKSPQSILKYINICCLSVDLDENVINICFKGWKKFNFFISYLFMVRDSRFIRKVLAHIAKHPERYLIKKESIKNELLHSMQSIAEASIPLDILAKVVQTFFNQPDPTTLYWLGRFYPNDIKLLLGRELSELELHQLKFCNYTLDSATLASVKRLIQKPSIPTHGNHNAFDISNMVNIFNNINFIKPEELNYCDPSQLKIDDKIVSTEDIKYHLNQLTQNVLCNNKIAASPEDPVLRQKFYDDVHNNLKHIGFLLDQKEPHQCLGYLLSLAEIGSKCATQYQELPTILYCIMQESNDVFIPCTIPLTSLRSPNELIQYFLQLYPTEDKEHILLKLSQLNDSMSPKEIYNKMSVSWLLAYMRECGLSCPSLEKIISKEIINLFEGKENLTAKQLKNIISRLHGLTTEKAKELLSQFVRIDFEAIEDLNDTLAKIESAANQMAGLIQPQNLKDHLLIYLHEARWKYFRNELSKNLDVMVSNVHNYKYIFNTLSDTLTIYDGYDNPIKYEDIHVIYEAKELARSIASGYTIASTPISIFPDIKKFLKTKSVEMVDWFKANAPEGKTPQQFLYEIYDDDYIDIKDDWILYMLQKMDIFKSIHN